MKRLKKFTSLLESNWLIGYYLLPLLSQWGNSQHGIVLDLGCGESPFRNFFTHAQKYIGIDRQNLDLEVVIGDFLNIPLPDTYVDTVLIFQALSDTPYLEDCLREINRVLKLQGKLIVFETMCYPQHDLPNDYFRIMPQGLCFLAQRSGFKVVELKMLGGLFTRFSSLWNHCVMGKLDSFILTKPLAKLGTLIANILFLILDQIFLHPNLASDYACIMEKQPLDNMKTTIRS